MSLKIKKDSEAFDLPPEFSVEIEDTSPIYNEVGSRSISATLPATKRNLRMTKYPNRVDADSKPEESRVSVSDGVYHRIGKLNITQGSEANGIVSNIGFDESELYNLWEGVTLKSLKEWPVHKATSSDKVTELLYFINDLLIEKRTHEAFHVFQICVAMPFRSEPENDKEVTRYYPEYLNHMYQYSDEFHADGSVREETFLIDNEAVVTSLPLGYGLTPFLKVAWLVDYLFSHYGYTVLENPFKTHPQLSRLVVLNNSADVIVKGQINYADLLPDCTINEFFQALYCRFGAIYFIDGKTKTVKLKFIKDIINAPAKRDWTQLKAGKPVINYNAPQQLKLSAATNIAGPYQWLIAAPAAESLDKFLTPYQHIVSVDEPDGHLYYNKSNGTFGLRHIYTKKSEGLSSDFFAWDRGAPITYHEISSVDECLPIKANTPDDDYCCPAYLFGKIHRYTTIESADVELKSDDTKSTPLCFCFSHPHAAYKYPFGSPRCYTPSGVQSVDKEKNVFDISLTFIGEHGLFNRFWKEYDAILRHANHSIEIPMHLNHKNLLHSNFSDPVSLSGQKLLPDITRYSLPLKRSTPATVKFRTLKLLRPYNLEEEQTVVIKPQLYKWVFSNTKIHQRNTAVINEVEEYKRGLIAEAKYVSALYKNEQEETVSDADLPPLVVPSEEDYINGTTYHIRNIKYSFTLYHKVQVRTGTNNWGQPVFEFRENKGKDYNISYQVIAKAERI